jgi:hypothetical protein
MHSAEERASSRLASATLSAGWNGKQDFLRAVGGGETAINNGMITWPPKDNRLSGLVLECLPARTCCVRRMK